MLWSSLTFRLTLLYALILSASMLAVCAAFYWISVHQPSAALQTSIRAELTQLEQLYRDRGPDALVEALERRRTIEGERAAFDALIAPSGRPLTTNLMSWPAPTDQQWLSVEADIHIDGGEIDGETLMIDHRFPDGTRLLLGRDREDFEDLEETIRRVAVTLLPITVLLAVIGGAFISRAVGHRIATLDGAAKQIMGGRLSARVPVAGTQDDLDRLACTLNLMLDRIEAAVEGLSRTSESVAHEMRTPLTRLRFHLESMAAEPGPAPKRLAPAVKEAERLTRMFDAVIAMTRLQTGLATVRLRPVDLSQILQDAAELFDATAERRKIRFSLDVDDGLPVLGNPDLLFQAVCNLIDNALKFTPAGGSVSLRALLTGNEVLVVLEDTGPGIPAELHALVRQRFFRAPSASRVPGLGLGLAFVDAVNSVHGAELGFANRVQGLRVEWRLKRFSADGQAEPAHAAADNFQRPAVAGGRTHYG